MQTTHVEIPYATLSELRMSADNVASDPKGSEAEEARVCKKRRIENDRFDLALRGAHRLARDVASMSTYDAERWFAEQRPKMHAYVSSVRNVYLKGDRKISAATEKSYLSDVDRVLNAGGDIRKVAGTRASFRKIRAACVWHAKEEIKELLLHADRDRKTRGNDLMAICLYASALPFLGLLLEGFKGARVEDSDLLLRREKPHGQRRKLGRLPKDWIQRVHRRTADGKYGLAVAVGSLIPIRPAEIAKGVIVRAVGSSLVFEVQGAKVQLSGSGVASGVSGIGQQQKGIRVDAVDPSRREVFSWLLKRVKEASGELRFGSELSARGLSSAFSSMSRSEFSNLSSPPSFYALRHAACAELKASGLNAQDLAKAMGHSSESSAQAYGTASQGSGGWRVRVVASGAVRSGPPKLPPPGVARAGSTASSLNRKQWKGKGP